jgi:hypothetical protein
MADMLSTEMQVLHSQIPIYNTSAGQENGDLLEVEVSIQLIHKN